MTVQENQRRNFLLRMDDDGDNIYRDYLAGKNASPDKNAPVSRLVSIAN